MKQKSSFFLSVCSLAVPVALQAMLQASFSIVDQIMIGQLGSVSVAGVGLAGKFASVFSVMASAVATVAGIMISQYLGRRNEEEVRRSFRVNLLAALAAAAVFTGVCLLIPHRIMGLYTTDAQTRQAAAAYLTVIAGTFFPMAGAVMISTLLRCLEKARLPLYASIASAVLNTVLNYILIFGKWGFPAMGAQGAAVATVIAQWVNFLLMALMMPRGNRRTGQNGAGRFNWSQYAAMLLPILVCEAAWSLGENVYAGIYGRMGTQAAAAMTLINPVQGLLIGALCGLSQAAGVIIGKKLGNREYDEAYRSSKKLMLYGAVGAGVLSVAVILTRGYYVEIYRVEDAVKVLTGQILLAYAVIAPFKVLNMILGGGIIRSGGKTKYIMVIDLIGTWGFGVPLGVLSAFVLKLPIPWVYFLLSLEECVRFGISVAVFRRRKWMHSLSAAERQT